MKRMFSMICCITMTSTESQALGNVSDHFIFGAANVDGDSDITISDAIGIVNIILDSGN